MFREIRRPRGDPEVLAAQSREQYFKVYYFSCLYASHAYRVEEYFKIVFLESLLQLKEKLQILTLAIGGVGLVSAYFSYTPEIAARYVCRFCFMFLSSLFPIIDLNNLLQFTFFLKKFNSKLLDFRRKYLAWSQILFMLLFQGFTTKVPNYFHALTTWPGLFSVKGKDCGSIFFSFLDQQSVGRWIILRYVSNLQRVAFIYLSYVSAMVLDWLVPWLTCVCLEILLIQWQMEQRDLSSTKQWILPNFEFLIWCSLFVACYCNNTAAVISFNFKILLVSDFANE